MPHIRSQTSPAASGRRLNCARLAATLALILGLAGLTTSAHAQIAGDGFLFKQPAGSLTLRGGLARADAASDIFAFTTRELTLDRGDFNGPAIAAEIAVRLSNRFDFTLGAGFSLAKASSEFRDWVDTDDQPIEQTTKFQRVPLTAGLKAYLTPRGRTIGSFAWLPARWAPYVGAGAGIVWYRFSQKGEFVDYQSLDIFPDHFRSDGWTPVGHLLAGFDISLNPRWALNVEGRYARARKALGSDFDDFQPIDLSGLTTSVGIQYSFMGGR